MTCRPIEARRPRQRNAVNDALPLNEAQKMIDVHVALSRSEIPLPADAALEADLAEFAGDPSS